MVARPGDGEAPCPAARADGLAARPDSPPKLAIREAVERAGATGASRPGTD